MSEGDEVFDGRSGARHVVDVDARRLEVGPRPLQHDREAVADEGRQLVVVGPRSGHDQAVDAARPDQVLVASVARCQRLDEDPVAALPGRPGQAPEGSRQEGVGSDLLGRLAEDEAEGQARPGGQLAGRSVWVVAELTSGLLDPSPGLARDLPIGPSVEDERHRRPRHAGPSGHVGTGRLGPGVGQDRSPCCAPRGGHRSGPRWA